MLHNVMKFNVTFEKVYVICNGYSLWIEVMWSADFSHVHVEQLEPVQIYTCRAIAKKSVRLWD